MACLVFDYYRNVRGDCATLANNIHWLHRYLEPAGVVDNGLEGSLSAMSGARGCFRQEGLAYSHEGWAWLYDRLAECPVLLGHFFRHCPEGLVLGFELSRAQKGEIARRGGVYLDLRLHPIRFLADYHLAAGTNDPGIAGRLAALAPGRRWLDAQVSLRRARAARRNAGRGDLPRGTVLFLQTAWDASRIHEGEFLDDAFLLSRLEALWGGGRPAEVHYKEHPHEKPSGRLVRALEGLGARATGAETYDLLSVEGLRPCSISSSVCHEARYFGRGAETLMPMPESFPFAGEEAEAGAYHMLPANLHHPGLWRHLLQGGPPPPAQWPEPAAPCRFSSGLAWG